MRSDIHLSFEDEMPSWASYNMLAFICFLALVAGAAFFGGQWGAGPWYRSLQKPSWTPPSWLFAPAWTLLYVMIAVAGFLVWNTPHPSRTTLLALWGVQLILNAFWSFIFFGRRDMRLALADIAGLWLTIVAFIAIAWPVNELAAILFMPYLVWISYAAALNTAILLRNPSPHQHGEA
jgi:tryptophan-rich sensory protein